MFLDFYHLHEQPFGVTPDPAYLYLSQTHSEALAALTEGIADGRGFLALIAEPGMGKTTLLYQVLEGLRDKARAVFLFQTQCNSREFFQYLLSELGVDTKGMGLVSMHAKLNEMLFAELWAGRRFVLIVDEAQNLDDTVLETIRLLSNFETSNTKLLQIVLAGQPQLEEKLQQKQLAQLLQRITVLKHLRPLSAEETAGYIRHRLTVAGYSSEELFEPEALTLIAERSQGVPRNINKICLHALTEAHAHGRPTVSEDIVEKADRKLDVGPAVRPAPAQARTDTADRVGVSLAAQLTYRPLSGFGSRGWYLSAAALLAALLYAGFAVPHNLPKKAMQELWSPTKTISMVLRTMGRVAVDNLEARSRGLEKSLVQNEEEEARLKTPDERNSTKDPQDSEQQPSQRGTPTITSIRVSRTENEARVVAMLDDPVRYSSARIGSPERIYFDLYGAQLHRGQRATLLGDELPKWVRVAQNKDDVVRLVLDADQVKDYAAQLLSDPYRLVIDAHMQPPSFKRAGSLDAGQYNAAITPFGKSASTATRTSLTRALGLKINRIVIDPGHGGSDTGAMGPHGLAEKSLCLDVAQRLGQLIKENIAGTEVVYTREEDKYVSLEERTAIANNNSADLFISIHANSSDSEAVRGVETYYLSLATSPESMKVAARENATGRSSLHDLPELIQTITRNEKISESKQLAGDIQAALSRRLELVSRRETNRGVKRAPFIVLTGANMPAVLSEISFLSNANDENLLLESSQRQRVAEGLYLGVAAYLDGMSSKADGTEKVASEKRSSTSSGFAQSAADIWRGPLSRLAGEKP